MKVANKTLFNSINMHLQRVTGALSKANTVVSSGRKINNLSDDPVGLVSVLHLRSSLSGLEQTGRNIDMGRAWLNSAETSLTQMESLLTETRALTVQMASATQGAGERANAATLVDGQLRQVLSLANAEVGGRYIFAGTKTDTTPFSLDDEDNPTLVSYAGNGTAFSLKLGKDITVEVGRNGEDVFGASGSSVFDALIQLKRHLLDNNVAGIQDTLSTLDTHLQDMRTAISDAGSKSLRLDAKERILEEMTVFYTERKSRIEDADIAEAITDLKGKELAYQAALASSSKVMAMSLLDYL